MTETPYLPARSAILAMSHGRPAKWTGTRTFGSSPALAAPSSFCANCSGLRVHVADVHSPPAIKRAVPRRHERIGGCPEELAFSESRRQARQVEGRGAAVHGNREP